MTLSIMDGWNRRFDMTSVEGKSDYCERVFDIIFSKRAVRYVIDMEEG